MSVATELCVQIPNEPGTLGAVSEVLGRAGINVSGFGVWEDCARLLVDDVDQALELLRGVGFTCRTNRVLCVDLPDEPGNLSATHAGGSPWVWRPTCVAADVGGTWMDGWLAGSCGAG